MIALSIAALLTLSFLHFRYNFFGSNVDGIPVLMYHKISDDRSRDFLTVPRETFEAQLDWLKSRGFQTISMHDYLSVIEGKKNRRQLPEKPILITFDDGYENNVSVALPILTERNMTAALFLTSGFVVGKPGTESSEERTYLTVEQVRAWSSAGMEVALHSHEHVSYRDLSFEEVSKDVAENRRYLKEWKIPFVEALAYPYGARPKGDEARKKLHFDLKSLSLRAAFRIGNRIHSWKNMEEGRVEPFDICRIDVRGDDPFFEFKTKVRKGWSRL